MHHPPIAQKPIPGASLSTRKDRPGPTMFSLLAAVPGYGLGSTTGPFQIAGTLF